MKYTYLFYEDAVAPELCNECISCFREDQFSLGATGSETINEQARNNDVLWLPKFSLIESILTRFIMQANQEALWNFDVVEPEEVQISRYKENQFYKPHMDCYIKQNDFIPTGNGGGITIPVLNQRKLSASLLLNDGSEYEGGDFIILNETVKTKKQGSIIVFPSFMAHQVTTVTRGIRYSAVCWMAGPKWK